MVSKYTRKNEEMKVLQSTGFTNTADIGNVFCMSALSFKDSVQFNSILQHQKNNSSCLKALFNWKVKTLKRCTDCLIVRYSQCTIIYNERTMRMFNLKESVKSERDTYGGNIMAKCLDGYYWIYNKKQL